MNKANEVEKLRKKRVTVEGEIIYRPTKFPLTDNCRVVNDIVLTDKNDRLVIEITGKAFANLKEIASIYNKWNDDNLTLSEVAEEFMFGDYVLNLNQKKSVALHQTFSGIICDAFCDVPDVDVEELKRMFASAEFDVN